MNPFIRDDTIRVEDGPNFTIANMYSTMASNKIFPKEDLLVYDKVSRFGYIDFYNIDQVSREYLFFTKPDLNIFNNNGGNGWLDDGGAPLSNVSFDEYTQLNPDLQNIPFFVDASERYPKSLRQLQYSVRSNDSERPRVPFMYLLTNTVTSKLDLPSLSAESKDVTPNIMGTTMQIRSHSYKSDTGYDFTLSFTDSSYLELYTLIKAYDEYTRLLKLGLVSPRYDQIVNRVIPEQFSIYKFLVGSDGETILFWAKLTGCYFTDVPRSDMSDPGEDGFKYSVSFHAQFVEDSNPMILSDFNRTTLNCGMTKQPVINQITGDINNNWAVYPRIEKVYTTSDPRAQRRASSHTFNRDGYNKGHDYRLKWFSGWPVRTYI